MQNNLLKIFLDMKKLLLVAFSATLSLGFFACNNGAYDANPNTNNSSTTNPLNQNNGGNNGGGNNGGGNSSFNWSGTDPMSALVDGVLWKAGSVKYTDQMGIIFISGFKNPSDPNTASMNFSFQNTTIEAGKIYEFNTANPNYAAIYSESLMDLNQQYAANLVGGKIKILECDATHVKGLFYFTGKNVNTNKTVTVTEGYFNVTK
jgi:hypothetical protein